MGLCHLALRTVAGGDFNYDLHVQQTTRSIFLTPI